MTFDYQTKITLSEYLQVSEKMLLKTQCVRATFAQDVCVLIEAIADCAAQLSKTIADEKASAPGTVETYNIQGERQKQLDILSNDMFIEAAEKSRMVAAIASEELEHPHISKDPVRDLLLLIDPLDGSSNIEVNITIGTIFSILPPISKKTNMPSDVKKSTEDFLQPGINQLAAGYVSYGPSTILVLTLGDGVVMFTLENNEWYQKMDRIKIPLKTNEFSINMSNWRHWQPGIRRYIEELIAGDTGVRKSNFNMRWVASMVADVHRILCRGGIFLYPWDQRVPAQPGKLRLLYEANPMSFLVEQASGAAYDGKQRLLTVQPNYLHQRVPVILGSSEEVRRVVEYIHQTEQ